MKYLILVYSLFLFLIMKKPMSQTMTISKGTQAITYVFFLSSLVNIFTNLYSLKLFLSALLLGISISLVLDRKQSGQKVNVSHHIIRLIIHCILIYCIMSS